MYPYKYIFPRYLQLYKYSQKCKIKTLFRVFVVMGVLCPSHRRDAALPYCWVLGGQNTPMWAQGAPGGIFKQSPLPPHSTLPSAPFPHCSPLGSVPKRRWNLGWCKRRSCRTGNHSRIPNCPRPADPSYSRKLLLSFHFLPSVLQPCSDSSSLFPIKVHYCC